jgi:hypothetical protein
MAGGNVGTMLTLDTSGQVLFNHESDAKYYCSMDCVGLKPGAATAVAVDDAVAVGE